MVGLIEEPTTFFCIRLLLIYITKVSEVKMEVNSLRSWKLKWTLHLLLAVVLSCTQCLTPYLTSPLTPCAKRIIPSKQSLRKLNIYYFLGASAGRPPRLLLINFLYCASVKTSCIFLSYSLRFSICFSKFFFISFFCASVS